MTGCAIAWYPGYFELEELRLAAESFGNSERTVHAMYIEIRVADHVGFDTFGGRIGLKAYVETFLGTYFGHWNLEVRRLILDLQERRKVPGGITYYMHMMYWLQAC